MENLCRLCLKHRNSDMHNVFTDNTQKMMLNEIIEKLCHVPVKEDDALPKWICFTCKNTLININKFITVCQQSYDILLKMSNDPGKNEANSMTTDVSQIKKMLPAVSKNLQCNICSKIFIRAGHLANHKRKHERDNIKTKEHHDSSTTSNDHSKNDFIFVNVKQENEAIEENSQNSESLIPDHLVTVPINNGQQASYDNKPEEMSVSDSFLPKSLPLNIPLLRLGTEESKKFLEEQFIKNTNEKFDFDNIITVKTASTNAKIIPLKTLNNQPTNEQKTIVSNLQNIPKKIFLRSPDHQSCDKNSTATKIIPTMRTLQKIPVSRTCGQSISLSKSSNKTFSKQSDFSIINGNNKTVMPITRTLQKIPMSLINKQSTGSSSSPVKSLNNSFNKSTLLITNSKIKSLIPIKLTDESNNSVESTIQVRYRKILPKTITVDNFSKESLINMPVIKAVPIIQLPKDTPVIRSVRLRSNNVTPETSVSGLYKKIKKEIKTDEDPLQIPDSYDESMSCNASVKAQVIIPEPEVKKKHKHFREKKFICHVCGSGFVAKSTFEKHMFAKHGQIIGKMSKKNMLYKLREFMNEQGISTEPTITEKKDLESQQRSSFECDYCKKKLRSKQSLFIHLYGMKPRKKMYCRYCAQLFTISCLRKKHMKETHHMIEYFKCPVCDKRFRQQKTIHQHLLVHLQEVEGCPENIREIVEKYSEGIFHVNIENGIPEKIKDLLIKCQSATSWEKFTRLE